jgi:hypothetical protein
MAVSARVGKYSHRFRWPNVRSKGTPWGQTCSEVVRRQARAQRAIVGRLLSETAREKQDDDDDEDDPNETVAAVPIAVARTAETATEATKQEDDEDYDEDGSERHDVLPLQSRNLN